MLVLRIRGVKIPINKTCPTCGKNFVPKHNKHTHCTRKCYKTDYNKKGKENNFPAFICPVCRSMVQLDFFPIKDYDSWRVFKCACGYEPGAVTEC